MIGGKLIEINMDCPNQSLGSDRVAMVVTIVSVWLGSNVEALKGGSGGSTTVLSLVLHGALCGCLSAQF